MLHCTFEATVEYERLLSAVLNYLNFPHDDVRAGWVILHTSRERQFVLAKPVRLKRELRASDAG
jgi:hypothetical protein